MLRTYEWSEGAVCAQVDPELFFDERPFAIATAKGICDGCPVREDCLATAMAEYEKWGMWGGLTPTERLRIHRATDPDFHWPGETVGSEDTAHGSWKSGQKTCARGHELTPENVVAVAGGRRCRACRQMHSARANKAKRAKRAAERERREVDARST